MTEPPTPIPSPDEVPHGWTAETLDDGWRWELDDRQVDQLVAAATQEAADASSLTAAIDRLHGELVDGRGFAVVSGLPVEDIGDELATTAMLVLSTMIGPLRPQNAAGDLVGHVRDTGVRSDDTNVRLYQTNERQTFHTDSADIVGLLSLATAVDGGESLLVNANAVFHRMWSHDPELARVLFDPIATDRRGEVPDGQDPFFTIPVFSWFSDRLTVMYQRQYIDSAARFVDGPQRGPEVVEALDLFDEICNDPAMAVRMRLESGDMQFVHNHSTLHDRTSFVDDPERPRHLIRTWITSARDRPLPEVFAQRFGSVDIGARGGVWMGS